MINQVCFRPFCNNLAEIKCSFLISQAFCSLHAEDHIHSLVSEHPIEKISNWIEATELQEHPFEAFNKNPGRSIEAILLQIYKQLLALQK